MVPVRSVIVAMRSVMVPVRPVMVTMRSVMVPVRSVIVAMRSVMVPVRSIIVAVRSVMVPVTSFMEAAAARMAPMPLVMAADASTMEATMETMHAVDATGGAACPIVRASPRISSPGTDAPERTPDMIAHLAGTIADITTGRATIATASGVSYEVMLPPYLDGTLGSLGREATLFTVHVLESPNQGASFIPRLMGFATAADREVYEAMTQIRGLGHRKALRALAESPTEVAAMIARGDEVGLKRLPEIGAKLAKTLVDELGPTFRERLAIEELEASVKIEAKPANPQAEDAVRALIALGEQPAEAKRKVDAAVARSDGAKPETAELVSIALSL